MNETIQKAREALASIPHGAIDALANNQRQLDMDGCEVGVSRQAVDEVLAGLRAALAAIDAALEGGAVPKVKGLVWEEDSFGNLRAETPFGAEFIQKWTETGSGAVWFEHEGDSYESQEAAQAAAQAAYERRILSALVPPESRS